MYDYTVRTATDDDAKTLEVLAALDSAEPIGLPALLAERDVRAVAAVELDSGRAVADPFAPSADAVALLGLRRSQLQHRPAVAAGRRRKVLALMLRGA
jgi:hypothetical protein